MDAELIFQPFGTDGAARTLGTKLVEELRSRRYRRFVAAVAFATSTGTSRICEALKEFTDGGGDALVFCGLSNGVTSTQAVEHLLTAGASVVGLDLGSRNIFHGKVYGFCGDEDGLLIMGSNNLTADGLYRHVEASAALRLDPRIDAERRLLAQPYDLIDWFRNNHRDNVIDLSLPSLAERVDSGQLLDEAVERPRVSGEVDDEEADDDGEAARPGVPAIRIPAPPPPGAGFAPFRRRRAAAPGVVAPIVPVAPGVAAPVVPVAPAPPRPAQALVLQIIPHDNGEIFLSKRALNERPAFFGYPFTAVGNPKFAKNAPYPHRQPDPIVHLRIYDAAGAVLHDNPSLAVNMIYNTLKKDVRITISARLARTIPEYSVLVMRESDLASGVDYSLEIFHPGSGQYNQYLARCTVSLPTGGKPPARRMGWI